MQTHIPVFIDLNCIFDGTQEALGAIEGVTQLIKLVGDSNVYIIGGLGRRESIMRRFLHFAEFWSKTGALSKNFIFSNIENDPQFESVLHIINPEISTICVMSPDYKMLEKFPNQTVRVFINYSSDELVRFEKDILSNLKPEDAQIWNTLLVMPSWNIHFSFLKRFILNPKEMLST